MPSNLQIVLTAPAVASVSIRPQSSSVASLTIGQQASVPSLSSVSDIIVTTPQDGDVLQYSAEDSAYVVGSLNLQGGSF